MTTLSGSPRLRPNVTRLLSRDAFLLVHLPKETDFMPNERKSKRGFAAMDANKQREIASKGGKAAHEKGTAHEFTPEEAREAGRKGGEAVSQNREHMAAIGRKGGESSHGGWESRGRQGGEDYSEDGKPETRTERQRNEGEEGSGGGRHGGSSGGK